MINLFDEKVNNLLRKLELSQGEFWNVSREVGEFFYLQVIGLKAKSILEVGTSNGYSGIWLASALKDSGGGKLVSVE